MIKRIFSSLGVGGAKVDTVLDNETIHAGDEVRGKVIVEGGSVDQHINALTIYTMAEINREMFTLWETFIVEDFHLEAKTVQEFRFSYNLPPDMPITTNITPTWLHTGMDISMAKDPTDNDHIEVLPHPVVQNAIDAFGDLGFELKEIDIEEAHPQMESFLPFIQEFEFKPTRGGLFYKKLDEVEVIFVAREGGNVDVYMEIDRRMGLIGGLLNNDDERRIHFQFEGADGYNRSIVGQMIQSVLEENL